MARPHVPSAPSGTFTIVLIAFVIGILHFGRDILIPFALAVLVTFLLGPMVSRLERWFGRVASALIVVLLLLGFFGFFGWIASSQLIDLAAKLPEYRGNIQKKVLTLRKTGQGSINKASHAIEELNEQLENPAQPSPAPADPNHPRPKLPFELANPVAQDDGSELAVPVRIVEHERTSVEFAQQLLGPLLNPLATAALVFLLSVFMLIQRDELRDRLILLIGKGRVGTTSQAFDDAAQRVSRYLLMQVVVNTTYGIPVAIGLYFIGVPNALLWGLLATVLRFIPYVGPWIAASMPIALSLAVFDSWNGPLATLGLFVVLELISNNIMEPWLYGSSTGVSSLAIILSGVFWAWLWGPLGLILATPLTVCLAVMGRHVPQLEFFSILLSDESVLPPEAHIYHRLLGNDPEEALEVAEKHMKQNSLTATYDEVLIPALTLAEFDAFRGVLDEEKQRSVHEGIREMLEELGDRDGTSASVESRQPVLCIPAKDEADEIAGAMLAQILEKTGVNVINVTASTLASEMMELVAEHGASTVCISVVPPLTVSHARYLAKRLRGRFPELRIFAGLWQPEPLPAKIRDRLLSAGVDEVATTLAQAVTQIR